MNPLRCCLVLVLTLAAGVLLRAEEVPATPAPAWKLKDVNGRTVSSSDFKGKVVVVDFWATWCGPCRVEIPGYIELQKKYRKAGLVIIGISCDQGKNAAGTVKTFVKKNGVNYRIVMADDDIQAAFGGMEYIPTTFIIDRAGNIRDRKVGVESTADYEARLLKFLK
jgi:thiol-disulfide isomerase/thioredoxin